MRSALSVISLKMVMLMNNKIIKATNLVEKRNILNEMKVSYFTLQEARIFAIYLSKINSREIQTRVVKFKLEEFLAIVNIRKVNISKLMETTNKLLSIIINIPDDNEGYSAFQLFKKCKVYKDGKSNEWCLELDAHDEALPLIFEFKNKYFTYQVDNVLRLNSSNQIRMYEILKQYEKIGSRIISLEKLRELIGIQKNEYPRFNNFKQWVIDPCQRALAESTDIKFTYEPYGKRGKGGKILFLKFNIQKNKDYIDQLAFDMDMFIPCETEEESGDSIQEERLNFFAQACNNEFTTKEILVLCNTMLEKLPNEIILDDIKRYDYIKNKYDEMNMRSEKTKIRHRFSYLKSIIGAEYE